MTVTTTRETERLRLRGWNESDVAGLALLHNDPDVMRYRPKGPIEQTTPVTLAGQNAEWQRFGYGLWAVELKETGGFIGCIGIKFMGHWPFPEVSWVLDKNYWNQGLATEGALATLKFGFEEAGIEHILSVAATPGNDASIRIMQKIGMRPAPYSICPLKKIPVVVYEMTSSEWAAISATDAGS